MNNKGLTLIELIISVILITVVMLFMYNLLNDVNNENNDNSYAQENQVNRSEIIQTIEDVLLGRRINLTEIKDESIADNLKLQFIFSDSTTAYLEATNNTITFTNPEGKTRKWTMVDATINIDKVFTSYAKSNGIYSLLINLEVYTDNDNNRKCPTCTNNIIDDIIISYVGVDELKVNSCLGYNCE